MVPDLQGWSFGSRRLGHVAVLVVVSRLFISVTDLGGCGLDLSPRMRSRRKRAQRAALLLLITALQTTLLHSHQVACGSLAPHAQRLLQLSILVSERRLQPARLSNAISFSAKSQKWIGFPVNAFHTFKSSREPFIPNSWIRCYPLQNLAPFPPSGPNSVQ